MGGFKTENTFTDVVLINENFYAFLDRYKTPHANL